MIFRSIQHFLASKIIYISDNSISYYWNHRLYISDDIFNQITSFSGLQRTQNVVLIAVFNSFGKSLYIPGQTCPGTKFSREEKVSLSAEASHMGQLLPRDKLKYNVNGTIVLINLPRQFLLRDNKLSRDNMLSRVHVNRVLSVFFS